MDRHDGDPQLTETNQRRSTRTDSYDGVLLVERCDCPDHGSCLTSWPEGGNTSFATPLIMIRIEITSC